MRKKQVYSSRNFTLTSQVESKRIILKMTVASNILSTKSLPQTSAFLKATFPSVLNSKCFNQGNLPFRKEVCCTELAHLFEHVLLEFLCLEKLKTGFDEAVFNGRTTWDWAQTGVGVFQITIDLRSEESYLLSVALANTTRLLEALISNSHHQVAPSALLVAANASQG